MKSTTFLAPLLAFLLPAIVLAAPMPAFPHVALDVKRGDLSVNEGNPVMAPAGGEPETFSTAGAKGGN
ncbi:MAG: hypothetical protein M4579_002054 [Chaenotheca gracillima]|nr:MAG: hypothetical protein M4579_002054 [Chaenotheca gracillima]